MSTLGGAQIWGPAGAQAPSERQSSGGEVCAPASPCTVPASQGADFGTGDRIPHPPQQLQSYRSLNIKETPNPQRTSQWAEHLCSVWLGHDKKTNGAPPWNLRIREEPGNLGICAEAKHPSQGTVTALVPRGPENHPKHRSMVSDPYSQPSTNSINTKKTHWKPPSSFGKKRLRATSFVRRALFQTEAPFRPSTRQPQILTELQAEAQKGQQCSQGQQQQKAIAEKHYYLFYLLFMVSPQIGNMSCEQSRGDKRAFQGGKPSLSTENRPISPGLWQGSINPSGKTMARYGLCLCRQMRPAKNTPFKLMRGNQFVNGLSDINREGELLQRDLSKGKRKGSLLSAYHGLDNEVFTRTSSRSPHSNPQLLNVQPFRMNILLR